MKKFVDNFVDKKFEKITARIEKSFIFAVVNISS